MKIIGLLIVKNEADILKESLDHMAKWMDGVVAIDNGSTDGSYEILLNHPIVLVCARDLEPFDESRLVPKLHFLASNYDADWYVDNDADEFFDNDLRELLKTIPVQIPLVTVDIHSQLNGKTYNIKRNWRRIYRNIPEMFDYSVLNKLHFGKVPLSKSHAQYNTGYPVFHKSIRSYEQGLRKYENYKKLDTEGIQKSYEHIREMAECLKTGDFTGVSWVS